MTNPSPKILQTDLHVLAHGWADATATPMILRADSLDAVEVRVAEPGPLVAMKLQNLPNRPSDKEATDLLDISRLLLDQSTARQVRWQLAEAPQQLREDALLHADLWFRKNARTSASKMKRIPEGRDTTVDDVKFYGELLFEALG